MRRARTEELTAAELRAIRRVLEAAWADDPEAFSKDDWKHAIGGVHFVLEDGGAIVAHASVVERELRVDDFPLATGYVEAVATMPAHQRRGHGSAVMRAVNDHIDRTFQLGALGTGLGAFYTRLGWVAWAGPTFVRTDDGPVRTEDEDGQVFVRRTPGSPPLDLSAPISCDWRPGDVW